MSTYLEIERKKQLDLLARAVYGWPDDGSRRTYSVAALVEAIGELRIVAATPIDVRAVAADAQALADVRTLDDWAATDWENAARDWRCMRAIRGFVCALYETRTTGNKRSIHESHCATPDEARAKAAAWVREQKAGT